MSSHTHTGCIKNCLRKTTNRSKHTFKQTQTHSHNPSFHLAIELTRVLKNISIANIIIRFFCSLLSIMFTQSFRFVCFRSNKRQCCNFLWLKWCEKKTTNKHFQFPFHFIASNWKRYGIYHVQFSTANLWNHLWQWWCVFCGAANGYTHTTYSQCVWWIEVAHRMCIGAIEYRCHRLRVRSYSTLNLCVYYIYHYYVWNGSLDLAFCR